MSRRKASEVLEEGGSFDKDNSAKINPEVDVKEENKAEWLKRRVLEDKLAKEGSIEVGSWYEISNGKLLKKVKKKCGNVCCFYIGKASKHKDYIATLKTQGKLK
jgi:hypothetical protein